MRGIPVAIRTHNKQRAVIFIHGFSGSADKTFGMLPAFLAGEESLYAWDLYSFGYPTSLSPDITGIWASDPDLTVLAGLLQTGVEHGVFAGYQELAIIAHSMGGLIVQRALLDGGFDGRVRFVFLFGTPSGGLRKAGLGKLFKRQARDMTRGGEFITQLRTDWTARYGAGSPFRLLAVAGTRDQFVPPESSVDPFPAPLRSYVDGNHLEMVKPEQLVADNVLLILNTMNSAGPQPAVAFLPDRSVVRHALQIERSEGTPSALAYLLNEHSKEDDTDVMGAIAGRLKRLWLADAGLHAAEGHQALSWYSKGLHLALGASDHEQAYYHGINVAFMQLALLEQPEANAATAAQVLAECALAPVSKWRLATEAEAHLYLGDIARALEEYAAALKLEPDAREIDSMFQQAVWAARLKDDSLAEMRLVELFQPHRRP